MSSYRLTPFACAAFVCALATLPHDSAEQSFALLTASSTAVGADLPDARPLGARPLSFEALAGQRGGSDAGSSSDLRLTGTVAGNSASNVATGNNVITDGALAGASGVPLVVQNSGNNVLIQNATVINVQVK